MPYQERYTGRNGKSVKRKKNKNGAFRAVVVCLSLLILAVAGKTVFDLAYDGFIRFTHPLKYQELVEKYAAENNVDKYLIYAIIKTESGFDPDAVSNMGARGLMQLMDTSFDWIKTRLGDEDGLSFRSMFDPEMNIRYGSYLIGYLMRYYGDRDLAICAYHAGTGNVDKWLADSRYSRDGAHLSVVPASDTAHYLDKVNQAIKNYKKIYKTEDKSNG